VRFRTHLHHGFGLLVKRIQLLAHKVGLNFHDIFQVLRMTGCLSLYRRTGIDLNQAAKIAATTVSKAQIFLVRQSANWNCGTIHSAFVIPITEHWRNFQYPDWRWNGEHAMDARYFREKVQLCLRLADGLSFNNPGRSQLMDLAEDFRERAEELETQQEDRNHQSKQQK
jgi:hypothetical protein